MDHSQPIPSPTRRIQAGLLSSEDPGAINKIFRPAQRERIARSAEFFPTALTPGNIDQHRKETAQIEVLFTTWGLPSELLTPDRFPSLKVIFYAGGSIKSFARPLLERGIQVVTSKAPNAVCVAQFCLAQIILACKGYFRNAQCCQRRATASHGSSFLGAGLYGEKIALLGMGAVARELVLLLRPFQLKVLAVDPYLSPVEAANLGVQLVGREEAFTQGYVVSNHLPDLPQLQAILNRPLFASMRRDATFINTGRGSQVNEPDLIEVFEARPDLTALLDVTNPEPPVADSPLYRLPNVHISAHIAGAINDDLRRLGDCVIEELERYASGRPFRYAERPENLDRAA